MSTTLFCKTLKRLKAHAKKKNFLIKKGKSSEISYGSREITLENSLHFSIVTFELAHEAGHLASWNGESLKNFNYFFNKAYGQNKWKACALNHIEKIYYEVDAWVTGAKFIPIELLEAYSSHAKTCLTTYLESKVDYKSELKITKALHRAPDQLRKALESALKF